MLNSKMRAQYEKDIEKMIKVQNEKMHTLIKPIKGSDEKRIEKKGPKSSKR